MSNKDNVYRLQGLSCANCAKKFEQNIRNIETVKEAYVNFAAAKVSVKGDISVEQIEKAGSFDNIKVLQEEFNKQTTSVFKKRENVLPLIAFFLLLFGVILQYSFGKENPFVVSIIILSIIVGGYDLFITGVKNLFRFYFDMKTLMTIAIIGAALIGEWVEGAIVVLLFA